MENIAQWIIVGLAVGGLIFNSGTLYNDVKHLKKDVEEIKIKLEEIKRKLEELTKIHLERKNDE